MCRLPLVVYYATQSAEHRNRMYAIIHTDRRHRRRHGFDVGGHKFQRKAPKIILGCPYTFVLCLFVLCTRGTTQKCRGTLKSLGCPYSSIGAGADRGITMQKMRKRSTVPLLRLLSRVALPRRRISSTDTGEILCSTPSILTLAELTPAVDLRSAVGPG